MNDKVAVQLHIHPASDAGREDKRIARAHLDAFLASLTPETDLRAAVDDFQAKTPIEDGIALSRIDEADLHGWWLRPAKADANRAILYLHGGGYAFGSAAAWRGSASQLVRRTGIEMLVLDYPLAPEQPFPAAYDAVIAALRQLAASGRNDVAVVGDSAGGGLALAVLAEQANDLPTIGAAVVFSAWTDLALTGESIITPAGDDPVITMDGLIATADRYLAGADPKDGRASPLYRIPAALPPIYLQAGGDERLLDDSRRYADLAAERGGFVRLDIWEEMPHVFQFWFPTMRDAHIAFDNAAQFLKTHWLKA